MRGGEERRAGSAMQRSRAKKTLNIWQLKWTFEGKEETEKGTEAATDEFERKDGRRGRDVFGHWMICVADMATEEDDDDADEAQVAVLFVQVGAAFDAAFRHSFLGGGTTE